MILELLEKDWVSVGLFIGLPLIALYAVDCLAQRDKRRLEFMRSWQAWIDRQEEIKRAHAYRYDDGQRGA